MLDRKQAYGLQQGQKLIVGRKNANPEAQIVLGGIGIQKNHAFFTVDSEGNIVLTPTEEAKKDGVKVNGVTINKPTVINHNDRIVFGTSNAFLFKEKNEPDQIDFDYIANEVMD